MKVVLLAPWNRWSKGHIFTDMPGGQARTLIDRGIAAELVDPPLNGAKIIERSPVDRMMRKEKLTLRTK